MCVPLVDTYGRGSSCEEHVCFPLPRLVERPVPQLAGSRWTRLSDRQPVDVVRVSAVMVAVTPELATPEPVDSPAPAGLAGSDGGTSSAPLLVWQVALEDDLSMEEEVVADLDFCESVVGGPTSTFLRSADMIIYLAGDVTVGVSSPADLAGDVTIGVSSTADLAGGVTVGVASLADLAGNFTVSVTSLADLASVVTTGAAFQRKCDVPSGSVCDYDDYCYDRHYDDNPDYFDYDDPSDFDNYPDVYGFIELDDYELYHDLHGLDHCGVYCVSRYDDDVTPN